MDRREVLKRIEQVVGLVLVAWTGWLLIYSNVNASPDSGPTNCGPGAIRVLLDGPSRNADVLGVGECRAAAVFALSLVAVMFAVGFALSFGSVSRLVRRRARLRERRAADARMAYASAPAGLPTALALAKPSFARQPPQMVVDAETVSISAPRLFGSRRWTVPLGAITVFDPDTWSEEMESAAAAEFDPPVRLAFLATRPLRPTTNLLLLFDPPQRIEPLKRFCSQAETLGIRPAATRRTSGLLLDGVHLQLEHPTLALTALADAGAPTVRDPIAWMDQRRARRTDQDPRAGRRRRILSQVAFVAIAAFWIAFAVWMSGVGDHDPLRDPALVGGVVAAATAWLLRVVLRRSDRNRSSS